MQFIWREGRKEQRTCSVAFIAVIMESTEDGRRNTDCEHRSFTESRNRFTHTSSTI